MYLMLSISHTVVCRIEIEDTMTFFKVFDGRGGKFFMVTILLAAFLPTLMTIEAIFSASTTTMLISLGSVALFCVVLMIIGYILEK